MRLLVIALLALASSDAFGQSRTVIEVEVSFHEARLRTYPDPNVRGSYKSSITLSGLNQIDATAFGAAGRAMYSEQMSSKAGEDGWRFVGNNTLQKTFDWPQSQTFMSVRVSGSRCTFSFNEGLKPGFREYKKPMLPRNEFGYYGPKTVTHSSCKIRNE